MIGWQGGSTGRGGESSGLLTTIPIVHLLCVATGTKPVTSHLSISFLLRLCVGLEGVAEGELVGEAACEARCVWQADKGLVRPFLFWIHLPQNQCDL